MFGSPTGFAFAEYFQFALSVRDWGFCDAYLYFWAAYWLCMCKVLVFSFRTLLRESWICSVLQLESMKVFSAPQIFPLFWLSFSMSNLAFPNPRPSAWLGSRSERCIQWKNIYYAPRETGEKRSFFELVSIFFFFFTYLFLAIEGFIHSQPFVGDRGQKLNTSSKSKDFTGHFFHIKLSVAVESI